MVTWFVPRIPPKGSLKKKKKRSIIALPRCVHFCSTTKWLSYTCAHVPSLLNLPPTIPLLQVITEHAAELPLLYRRFPLAIYFTHSSALAWKIPWKKEPGRLQSMVWLRVWYDWVTSLSLFTFMHWRRKWQPTPVFLPGESQGWGSLVGCRLWGRSVGHDWSDLAAAAAAVYIYICQCYSPNLSYPPFPLLCSYVHSRRLCLYSCPANRFISFVDVPKMFLIDHRTLDTSTQQRISSSTWLKFRNWAFISLQTVSVEIGEITLQDHRGMPSGR